MASTVGGIFDEYASLKNGERSAAIAAIGVDVFDTDPLTSSGNDVYVFTPGSQIKGSPGIDLVVSSVSITLSSGVEDAILTGTENIDATGNSQDNVLIGNEGNNILDGKGGRDALFGADGDDTLIGSSSADSLYGGMGNDCLEGGSGSDCIDGGEGSDTIESGTGDDSIQAGDGNNVIFADSGNDSVTAGNHDDFIWSGSGNDSIYAGQGNNTIDGGSGNDRIIAGAGDDCISGGTGNDTIYAGGGYNSVYGGSGSDQFFFTSGSGTTWIEDFKIGQDVIHVQLDINETGIDTPQDILANHVSQDAQGNAVITFGSMVTILEGVHAADLKSGVFIID